MLLIPVKCDISHKITIVYPLGSIFVCVFILQPVYVCIYNNQYILCIYTTTSIMCVYNNQYICVYNKEYIVYLYHNQYIVCLYHNQYMCVYNNQYIVCLYHNQYMCVYNNQYICICAYMTTRICVYTTTSICMHISERSARKKKTGSKLTGLVLLRWGELKMAVTLTKLHYCTTCMTRPEQSTMCLGQVLATSLFVITCLLT